MKRNEEITQELVNFIAENEDCELNDHLCEVVGKALTDENGIGDNKKAFCALAKVTSVFMKMWANMTPENRTATEMMESWTDVLDFYCLLADLPEEENTDEP